MNKFKTILPCTIKRTLVFGRTKSFVRGINIPSVGIGRRIVQGLIFSIAFLSAGLLFASAASANGNLVVQFENTPLFNEASFLPGDTVTQWVKVTNNAAETQKIGTSLTNFNDPGGLGDVLYLEIEENANLLYEGTLSEFYAAGEKYLSDLGAGVNTTYNYSITFGSDAGDDYQGLGLGFDISVGFFGQESVSTEVSSGGGGTGGSGYVSDSLIISNEAIEVIGPDTVTITWDTNLISTSRVIYSPSPAPSFNIGNPPNYGYTYSTIEDSNKVLEDHTVTITGLTSGTVYFFRCVSHASPDTLSPEYSFATLSPGEPAVTEETPLQTKEEVLGASIIRTALPETGGIIERIAKKAGFSSAKSNDFGINLIIAGALFLIWIGLFVLRRAINHKNNA